MRFSWWDQTAQDVRFAVRSLRRQPGFTAAAVLTLAFGIGAATSILSVVNGILVRPLPYPNAARAVLVWSGSSGPAYPLSAPNYKDLAAETGTLEQTAAFRNWNITLTEDGRSELLAGARVGSGLFGALGVHAARGRVFRPDDETTGSEPVAVIGDALWRRRFGADPGLVGRLVTLNGQRVTVIGIMPPGFQFPRGAELPAGLQFGARTEVWTPLILSETELRLRGLQNLAVIAALKPGVTPASAQADLDVFSRRLAERIPDLGSRFALRVTPMVETAVAAVRPALLVLLGAVGFLLLIACVNVSNLLLTRTAARTREVALRGALGAGPGRLARQFATENLLLALVGGVLGVLAASLGRGALLALAPAGLPRVDDIALDWRVLGGIVLAVTAIGLGFGLLVASAAVGGDRSEALREGNRGGAGRGRRRFRDGLVVVEVAVSVMLLAGAGALGRTFQNLRQVEPGFRADSVLTARLTLPLTTSDFSQFGRLSRDWARFYQRFLGELADRPGVRAAAVVTSLPLSGAWESSQFAVEGRPPAEPGQEPSAVFIGVSKDYFRAMGIPVVQGRGFTAADEDTSAATIVISEAMARAYWPGANPVGQRISGFFRPSLEIVGVVGDVRHRDLAAPAPPTMYLSLGVYPSPSMTAVVRTAAEPMAETATVQAAARAADPGVPVTEIRLLADVAAGAVAQQRFSATLIGAFALAALALAVLGLYGVVSFGVARRTRELGVRLALGAVPGSLMTMVLREGLVLSLVGVGIGIGGALLLGRALGGLVYGVSPTDPVTLGVVSLVLVLVALGASLVPARRATRIDLVTALREE